MNGYLLLQENREWTRVSKDAAFFVTPDQVKPPYIYIKGSDVNHMKNVLRMREGEELVVSDGNNQKYLCVVEHFKADEAVVSIRDELPLDTELSSRVYLFQGLLKVIKWS